MYFKLKVLRILCNGILFFKSEEEKKEVQLINVLMHSLFFLTVFFSFFELHYGMYYQLILNFIILIPVMMSHYLIGKGFYNFSKLFCVQSVIVFIFLSNLCYTESESFLYLYLVVIANMPIVFRVKDMSYIVFFVAESFILFFTPVLFNENLDKICSLSPQQVEKHKDISSLLLIVCLSFFMFIHITIVQYRESKLKKNRAKLIDIKKRLECQNEDLQRFGLAVTHSLKTPLILINGFLDKIRNNIINDTGREMNHHYFKIIKDSNNLVEKYSEDLSAYNSVLNIQNKSFSFDISKVIDDQIVTLKARFENARIINKVEGLTISVSLLLFEIIVQTLIENAIIYNDSEIPTLLIYSTYENNKINIYFKDNGIGIDEEFKFNIFLPFVRINKKANVKGSGLGLTSTKIACDKIGAKISILESNKEGSIFKLELL